MPKYLVLWEVDSSRAPTDAKERGAMWSMMVDQVKQDLKTGRELDWGCFVGEPKGYSVDERSEIDIAKDLQRFYPFLRFEVHQVMSIDEIAEVAKSLTE
jgi:hypothetical protein